MSELVFGLQSYAHRSLPVSAQRSINCYLEKAPEGAKTQFVNTECHGIASFGTVGSGVMRGGLVVNATPWVVSGTELYTVSSAGVGTLKGTIPGSGVVNISSDGTNVLVIASGNGYLWNGSTLALVADADFPSALVSVYLNGYAIVIELGTGNFWINETAFNWTNWNALDGAAAEGWPDDILDAITDQLEVFLGGRETIEVWYDNGNADFPLIRRHMIERGVLCTGTFAKHDNSIFFVGNDGVVYRLEGYTPVRISQHAVEQMIENLAVKSIQGSAWTEGGHAMYGITSAEWTLVYDVSTGLWHERKSSGYEYWRGLKVLRAYGKWLVLDSTSNKIGYLSDSTFTEWGDVLRASATAPSISSENRWLFHSRVELEFENGVGLLSGQGSNPQVMLDWSDDGGRTWSAEHFRPLGKTGEYKSRAVVNRLGRSRDRVYRYAISDPVRRTLVRASFEAEIGEH